MKSIRIIGSQLRYLLKFIETNPGIENKKLVAFPSLNSTDIKM